jgi:enolase
MKIESVRGRVVFDSRGDKTIEAEVVIDGRVGRAGAPAGKSRGRREAEPYPRGGPEEAARILQGEIGKKLVGVEYTGFRDLDQLLREIDGTENFSRIGGNTALAVSVAAAQAYSSAQGVPLYRQILRETGLEAGLPLPLGNALGGGKHAGAGAPEIQEFLVIPLGARNIFQAIEANIRVHKRLGSILAKSVAGYPLGKGDEGGYAPPISVEAALECVREAAESVSDEMGIRIGVGLDVAAGSIYNEETRRYEIKSQGLYLSRDGFLSYLAELCDRASLVYVEDPFVEDDPDSRHSLIDEYAEKGAINAAIIKPNQVGTLYLTWLAARSCLSRGVVPVASHRSGETTDAYLSHVAVGMGCRVIKSGIMGGERLAKANELIRIGEEIGAESLRRVI